MTDTFQVLLPRPDVPVENQPNEVLFAMLIFGEARGEAFSGKCGVASVVRNRVQHPRWWGHDLREVVLRHSITSSGRIIYQFSCFNPDDPNREKLLWPLRYEDNTVWDECYEVAIGILENDLPDITKGSDHYFDNSINPPSWARPECKTVTLGRLNFYRLEI